MASLESAPKKQIVAFGELLLRLDTPGHERLVQAADLRVSYTGAEANTAVALAQWGHGARVVSKVPAQELGQACTNHLRRYGLNTDWVARGGPRLGILYVETGAAQRPTKVVYDRLHTSFREVAPEDFDWEAILRGQDWFHFSGTAPALGPQANAALRTALTTARRLGVTVSLDVNYRSTLWSLEEARRVLPTVLPDVNVLIGTTHDAELLFGIGGEAAASADALRRRFGFRAVAYTLRRGQSASVNRLAGLLCTAEQCSVSREYEMQMVDRIGGGDAFSAGVIYGLLAGWEAARTVEFAVAAACLKHSIPGDFGLLSLDEVRQLAEHGESGRIQR